MSDPRPDPREIIENALFDMPEVQPITFPDDATGPGFDAGQVTYRGKTYDAGDESDPQAQEILDALKAAGLTVARTTHDTDGCRCPGDGVIPRWFNGMYDYPAEPCPGVLVCAVPATGDDE